MGIQITSTSNPLVRSVAALSNPRQRRETGLCVIEGHDEIALAVECGTTIETAFMSPEHLRAGDLVLLGKLEKARTRIVETTEAVLAKMAYREHPDTWLAVARIPATDFKRLEQNLPDNPLLIILENVEKPGNIGAVLRSADTAGVHGIIACDCRTDMGNPNVIRASKGTVFSIPVVECDVQDALNWLAARSIPIHAASPDGGTYYWNVDFNKAGAVVFGAEHEGLSGIWLEQCSTRINIPMQGRVNSLNIAQAATLIAYESLRQRLVATGNPAQ